VVWRAVAVVRGHDPPPTASVSSYTQPDSPHFRCGQVGCRSAPNSSGASSTGTRGSALRDIAIIFALDRGVLKFPVVVKKRLVLVRLGVGVAVPFVEARASMSSPSTLLSTVLVEFTQRRADPKSATVFCESTRSPRARSR